MNLLFGDATSQMPTPASGREGSALMQSPVPSLHLGEHGPNSAIPGLDINPPSLPSNNGKPVLSRGDTENKEGVGGWITSLVKRTKKDKGGSGSGSYQQVDQSEE